MPIFPDSLPGCIQYDNTYIETQTNKWSCDACATVVSQPIIREECNPLDDPTCTIGIDLINLPNYYDPGFAEIATAHSVRMLPINSGPNEEKCHIHVGYLAMQKSGFLESVMGNEFSTEELRKNVKSVPFIANKVIPELPNLELGFAYFVGAYQTPVWLEAHLSSQPRLCLIVD